MTNSDLLRHWYDRIWIDEDLDAIEQVFTPDSATMMLLDFALSPEDMRSIALAILAQIRISHVDFLREVEMGDWVWVGYTVNAHRRRDEKPITFSGQVMARFCDGKILESFNQADMIGLFEQLELLPEHTMELCMSGEGIEH
ncbi:nuclear transport factor 2 family protein [Aliiroseovarius marinus]|uniref:nuclear transport factor 2 family protein n=1 Tax=Aliiroseovarius marinus TaxID=2500159 RepID=UPI003D7E870E